MLNASTVAEGMLLGVGGGKGFTGDIAARDVAGGSAIGPKRFSPIQNFL